MSESELVWIEWMNAAFVWPILWISEVCGVEQKDWLEWVWYSGLQEEDDWSSMPFCRVADYSEKDDAVASNGVPSGVEIFYQLYGHGDTKVLLITGQTFLHLTHTCNDAVPWFQCAHLKCMPLNILWLWFM